MLPKLNLHVNALINSNTNTSIPSSNIAKHMQMWKSNRGERVEREASRGKCNGASRSERVEGRFEVEGRMMKDEEQYMGK